MIQRFKLPIGTDSDAENRLKRYLSDRISAIKEGLRTIHEERVVNWRKIYEATPAEAIREFPFHNASNIVIPVVAIHADTLLARIMAAVFKTQPLWVARIIGEAVKVKNKEELKRELEKFLAYVGIEPTELDLYRVYHEWFGETIRCGTSVLKCPQLEETEDIPVAGDGSGKITSYEHKVTYAGPKPDKLPFRDFGIPPSAKTIEAADFKFHRVRLQKQQLEERAFLNIYDKQKTLHILKSPDATSPDRVQSLAETDAGAKTIAGYGWAEWHIYECHFRYRIDGSHFVRCIVWYHEKSDTILRAYFNYYPDEIFVAGRLFYRDDMFYGYGFAEILASIQEEISQIHNGRRDNQTVANTRVWRVDPESKLHQGYQIYPSAMVPALKDEIEPLQHGEISSMSIDEERLALDLAERRSGVSPPMQGMGAGTNTKRGVYTAMGTLSLLQEGNTRTDLNITDMRYAHTRVGRILCGQYSQFGIGDDRERLFSSNLRDAIEAIKTKELVIPVYSSSASVNREVEKQNDMMLSGVMQKHYQAITQMLQAVGNQMMPENVRAYLTEAIDASNALMKAVLIHFGYEDPEVFVPDAKKQATGPSPSPGSAPQIPPGQPQQGAPGAMPTTPPGAPPAGLPPGGMPGMTPSMGKPQ